MPHSNEITIRARIVIEQPVTGVLHSLQSKAGDPVDPKRSLKGEALAFNFPIRIAPGPRFLGDQVRREGPARRFVYIAIGQLAGDPSSPWARRMKIDIHDLDPDLIARAAESGRVLAITIFGTGSNGTPACASVRPAGYALITG